MENETGIEGLFDLDDGALVRLVLEENVVPRVEESFERGSYVRFVLALERGSASLQSRALKDVVGYFSQFEDRKCESAVLYPMARNILPVNSAPPIQIVIPVTGIASYEVLQESQGPVTAPIGFP